MLPTPKKDLVKDRCPNDQSRMTPIPEARDVDFCPMCGTGFDRRTGAVVITVTKAT